MQTCFRRRRRLSERFAERRAVYSSARQKLAVEQNEKSNFELAEENAKIEQKKLFATTDGIIQAINVHEGELTSNDPRNPNLILKIKGIVRSEFNIKPLAVHKALVGIRDRFNIDVEGGEDLSARGNVVDHEYEIKRDGDVIATVSKKWLRVRDTAGNEGVDVSDRPQLADLSKPAGHLLGITVTPRHP